jgi:hypothetical protein
LPAVSILLSTSVGISTHRATSSSGTPLFTAATAVRF